MIAQLATAVASADQRPDELGRTAHEDYCCLNAEYRVDSVRSSSNIVGHTLRPGERKTP